MRVEIDYRSQAYDDLHEAPAMTAKKCVAQNRFVVGQIFLRFTKINFMTFNQDGKNNIHEQAVKQSLVATRNSYTHFTVASRAPTVLARLSQDKDQVIAGAPPVLQKKEK